MLRQLIDIVHLVAITLVAIVMAVILWQMLAGGPDGVRGPNIAIFDRAAT